MRYPRPLYSEETDRYSYQQKFNRFEIPPGSIVLDVGNGAYPFPHATILGDRFVEITRHRPEPLVRDKRPFVLFDVQSMPFASKSVDFVYCSHVLEHVDEPLLACQELMRVGKEGYIEAPNYAKDALFGWAHRMHKWHVTAINDYLLFFEYTERQAKGMESRAWYDLIFSQDYNELQAAFWSHQDLFNTMFRWRDRFNCVVFRIGSAPQCLIPREDT